MPMSSGTVSTETLIDYFFGNDRSYSGSPSQSAAGASANGSPSTVNDPASIINGQTYYPVRLLCGSTYNSSTATFAWSSIRGKGYVGNMGPVQGPPSLYAPLGGNAAFYDYTNIINVNIVSAGGSGTNIVQAVVGYFILIDWDSTGTMISWRGEPDFIFSSGTYYDTPVFHPPAAGGRGGGFTSPPSFGYTYAGAYDGRFATLK